MPVLKVDATFRYLLASCWGALGQIIQNSKYWFAWKREIFLLLYLYLSFLPLNNFIVSTLFKFVFFSSVQCRVYVSQFLNDENVISLCVTVLYTFFFYYTSSLGSGFFCSDSRKNLIGSSGNGFHATDIFRANNKRCLFGECFSSFFCWLFSVCVYETKNFRKKFFFSKKKRGLVHSPSRLSHWHRRFASSSFAFVRVLLVVVQLLLVLLPWLVSSMDLSIVFHSMIAMNLSMWMAVYLMLVLLPNLYDDDHVHAHAHVQLIVGHSVYVHVADVVHAVVLFHDYHRLAYYEPKRTKQKRKTNYSISCIQEICCRNEGSRNEHKT